MQIEGTASTKAGEKNAQQAAVAAIDEIVENAQQRVTHKVGAY